MLFQRDDINKYLKILNNNKLTNCYLSLYIKIKKE